MGPWLILLWQILSALSLVIVFAILAVKDGAWESFQATVKARDEKMREFFDGR